MGWLYLPRCVNDKNQNLSVLQECILFENNNTGFLLVLVFQHHLLWDLALK